MHYVSFDYWDRLWPSLVDYCSSSIVGSSKNRGRGAAGAAGTAAAGMEGSVKRGGQAGSTSQHSVLRLVCSGQRFAASSRHLGVVRLGLPGGAQEAHRGRLRCQLRRRGGLWRLALQLLACHSISQGTTKLGCGIAAASCSRVCSGRSVHGSRCSMFLADLRSASLCVGGCMVAI